MMANLAPLWNYCACWLYSCRYWRCWSKLVFYILILIGNITLDGISIKLKLVTVAMFNFLPWLENDVKLFDFGWHLITCHWINLEPIPHRFGLPNYFQKFRAELCDFVFIELVQVGFAHLLESLVIAWLHHLCINGFTQRHDTRL